MGSMSHARRTTALLLATGFGLAVAGCGGSAPKAEDPPSASPTSSTPTPTASATTPSPTPTVRPLSRFEGKPPVKALRTWAKAYGRAVNDKNRSLSTLVPLSTADGMKRFPRNASDDFGTYFPGPLPFTPVRVRVAGSTSVVTSCLWVQGWGQDPGTKLPVKKRAIGPADLVLKKVAGRWKVDQLLTGSNDCSQVSVKGIPW